MKLYYAKGACSLVVRIIINEIGLHSEYESVNLRTKTTQTGTDFYAINHKGSVPALVLDNGDLLTENAVMLQYLADDAMATQLLPSVGDFNRYRVLEWLNYTTTEMHKSFGPLFNPHIPQEIKDSIFIPIIKTKLTYIDDNLGRHRYLLGGHFTLPDAYMFVMLLWAGKMNIDIKEWSHVSRYFAELEKRKSIQQALKEDV